MKQKVTIIFFLINSHIYCQKQTPPQSIRLLKKSFAGQENTKKSKLNQEITIHNNITPIMLKYKHWTGTYNPTFTICVNNTKIEQGQTVTLPKTDKLLVIRYDYSFANGYKKGTHEVTCIVANNAKNVHITFDWTDANRIILENGTVLEDKKVNFTNKLHDKSKLKQSNS